MLAHVLVDRDTLAWHSQIHTYLPASQPASLPLSQARFRTLALAHGSRSLDPSSLMTLPRSLATLVVIWLLTDGTVGSPVENPPPSGSYFPDGNSYGGTYGDGDPYGGTRTRRAYGTAPRVRLETYLGLFPPFPSHFLYSPVRLPSAASVCAP